MAATDTGSVNSRGLACNDRFRGLPRHNVCQRASGSQYSHAYPWAGCTLGEGEGEGEGGV